MKVWIDLANSPHALLFAPVVRRLESLGHAVALTVRDYAQTRELARQRWDDFTVIGGPSPAGSRAKAGAMLRRTRELARWARDEGPDVALSHNSYGQILAARRLTIPAVTAMDFEHQPVNHLAFRLADTVLLPSAIDRPTARRQGARSKKTRFYDGLKEEIYLGDFEPDAGVFRSLGLQSRPAGPLVVARTPPSRAIYHRFANPLFVEALRAAARQPDARCVVLVRHPEQRHAITALGLDNVILPEHAVDARSLMYAADLVLGAGGTMTREAALLGVPTVSLFAGRSPGVDRLLERQGALRSLRSADELVPIRRRSTAPHSIAKLRERSDLLIEAFVEAATVTGRTPAVRLRAGQPLAR
jgi:predicted glycosyltransferase